MRARVEDAFWLPKLGFYAQALDGDKRPVEAMSSNPGHLLMAALPSPVRARMVVERMRRPDMDSGWGVRTLSTAAPTYNPMSYHNGSVWPHDNSLIGAGCFAQGHAEDGNRLFRSLLDSALTDTLDRLPELFCGFSREGVPDERPVRYPVSCSPQAWAAGSLLLLLRGALGLLVDPSSRRIRIEPSLPDWLSSVHIDGLSALGFRGSVTVTRDGDGYRIRSDGLPIA